VNRAGVLLDTGPLVALLSKRDSQHERAATLFSQCLPPLRCCEAVVAEACFLMSKIDTSGPAEVIALARKGVFEIALSIEAHWAEIEALLKKYANRPSSLADTSLIRCAEIHSEPRILTFDGDFSHYRWARHRKFQIL
jgi:predicted nucleic acid-binding protein